MGGKDIHLSHMETVLACWFVDFLFYWLVGWLAGCLLARLVAWCGLVGRPAGRPAGWLAGWLVGWLVWVVRTSICAPDAGGFILNWGVVCHFGVRIWAAGLRKAGTLPFGGKCSSQKVGPPCGEKPQTTTSQPANQQAKKPTSQQATSKQIN